MGFAEEGTSAEIREVVKSVSPGAAVKLYGKTFGECTITANGTNKDDPVYWSMIARCSFNITLAKGHISITENPGKVYDGEAVDDPTAEKNGDGKVTYKYYEGGKAEGTALSERPKNAGTYTVVAHMEKSERYTEATSEPLTFTIEKRPVTIGLSTEGTDETGNTVTLKAVIMGEVDVGGSVKFTVTSDGVTAYSEETQVKADAAGRFFLAESSPLNKTSIPAGSIL